MEVGLDEPFVDHGDLTPMRIILLLDPRVLQEQERSALRSNEVRWNALESRPGFIRWWCIHR